MLGIATRPAWLHPRPGSTAREALRAWKVRHADGHCWTVHLPSGNAGVFSRAGVNGLPEGKEGLIPGSRD